MLSFVTGERTRDTGKDRRKMDRKSPHEDGDRAKSINFPEIVRRGLVSKTRRFSTKDTDKSERKRRETRIAAKIPIKEQRTHNFGLLAINELRSKGRNENRQSTGKGKEERREGRTSEH